MGQASNFDNIDVPEFEEDEYIEEDEIINDDFNSDILYKNTIILINKDKNKKPEIKTSSFKFVVVNKSKILSLYCI